MAEIGTRKPRGIIRTLDPSDPRNPNHSCHDEQWLELARVLGRTMADRDWERLHGERGHDEKGGSLRTVLQRSTKRPLD
jgi:hypothetical protein